MKQFFKEVFGRLTLKSPSFFVIVQRISVAVTVLSGLPMLLQDLHTQTGVVVPQFMTDFSNKIFFFCGIVTFIVAKLPVENPDATKLNKEGNSIKKLPFTNKK